MVFQRSISAISSLAIMFLLMSHTADASSAPSTSTTADKSVQLAVYKSPTCGCCKEWMSHLQSHGLKSNIHHPDDLNAIKNRYRISPQYQSCHTAASPEGAIGLAIPGMPVGSPGMEMGERFIPYDVLLLKSDGCSDVYINITSLTQTF